jgi:uncharacterized repeat protein (TIGR03803 family)
LAAVLMLAAIATTLAAPSARAQQLTTLATFDVTNGFGPVAPLVQGNNGKLYGSTNENYGSGYFGSLFDFTTSGTLTSFGDFCASGAGQCANGGDQLAGLVQAANGKFYGTNASGGDYSEDGYGGGTIFEVTPSGTLTVLHTFCQSLNGGGFCADGSIPTGGLLLASNGDLYGTTSFGGAFDGGTVFKITTEGVLTTLYNFCPGDCGDDEPSDADGFYPAAGLIQATDGALYGTTTAGGVNRGNQINGGVIFKMTLAGKLTVLYAFCAQTNCADGLNPTAVLVQASNGNIYGTTLLEGANGHGTIFEFTTAGKFKFTTLYSFCSLSNCSDGSQGASATALSPMIQGTDGNLYGTTPSGGNTTSGENSNGYGTIFQMTPSGGFKTIYTFCTVSNCPDGGYPVGGLIQDTNGNFYGTTVGAGTVGAGAGTVFSLSMGLGPFVKTRPISGKVGAVIDILGTDLTGATGVMFNGTPASFSVISKSQIKSTVPTGATTGVVQVTTPSGTLTGNVSFGVP